jgi:glycerol-3-phosphate O-acyltransferase
LLLRAILHLWIRARVLPDADGGLGVAPGGAVCYVMADYALSSILILDRACEDLQLDRPLLPISDLQPAEPRAYAVLRRLRGLIIRRPSTRRSSEVLRRLVEYSAEHPETNISLVPVSVFVGRAPDKETGVAKIMFAENWEVAGRFRRFLGTLINGRDTVVQFSRPISLRQMIEEDLGPERTLRKVSRILRTHLRRVRTAAIGPDLSHRRTVVDGVVRAPAVRNAIRDKAKRDGISEEKAAKVARKYAHEIAANYSYAFVRIAFFFIRWFEQRMYQGLHIHNLERLKGQALDHSIVYVPCHRSHADYVLLSYLLYQEGLVPPHTAAGLNLNMPLVGPLLRRGGAFYLRRSFRSKKLYSAVFSEYVSSILNQGVSIEYFIEGTRSRSGRLLAPKSGMLAMTVRAYLGNPARSLIFQPVYIGYEKLVEGASYTRELAGAKKQKESLGGFFRGFGKLWQNYGEVHVSFGEPISLDLLLDQHSPDWREQAMDTDEKPAWLNPLVHQLGGRIMRAINSTANVNSINLAAMVLLATPKHAIDRHELLNQLALYRRMLDKGPLGGRISITPRDDLATLDHLQALEYVECQPHPLGDIFSVKPAQAVELTYFRNNVAHLFATPALIACCFLLQRRISREALEQAANDVYPLLRAELFLPWGPDEFGGVLEKWLEILKQQGLLKFVDDGKFVERAAGGSDDAGQLILLARGLLPTLERFYITVAVLDKNGSGTLTRVQLERLCILTAQRISLLQEFGAPEFSDRNLFRQLIAELRRQGMLVADEQGCLEFEQHLGRMGKDARLFLHKEIRHSIIRAAPSVLEESANGAVNDA